MSRGTVPALPIAGTRCLPPHACWSLRVRLADVRLPWPLFLGICPSALAGCTRLLSGGDAPEAGTLDARTDSSATLALCETVIASAQACGVTAATTCRSDWLDPCAGLGAYYSAGYLEAVVACERALGWPYFCADSGSAGMVGLFDCVVDAGAQAAPTAAATQLVTDFCASCSEDASMANVSCSSLLGWDYGAVKNLTDTMLEEIDQICTGAALASSDGGSPLDCGSLFEECYDSIIASFPPLGLLLGPPAACATNAGPSEAGAPASAACVSDMGSAFGGGDCADASPTSPACGATAVLCDGGTLEYFCTCGGTCTCSVNGAVTGTFSSATICDSVAFPPSVCPL
jgi:hypothetical protein